MPVNFAGLAYVAVALALALSLENHVHLTHNILWVE